jgi:NitT/TauT family transport system substrate-binding protein
MKPRRTWRRRPASFAHAFAVAGLLALAACGSDDPKASSGTAAAADATSATAVTLRLGYFPNVTHAPALVGLQEGLFQDSLGPNVTLETSAFNAGPEAIEAIASGALDASFIGPNPAINYFAKTNGEGVRIVSGTTSGGAFFVVKPEINGPKDLKGKSVASPQLGGTQDVALRSWLQDNGLETDTAGGGDVSVLPQANADTLAAFIDGSIVGAWVPEPWATRLILEGGGKVLVDERDLWPDGQYVTTHLIVTTEFLEKHPDTIANLLRGLVASIDAIDADPAAAQAATNAGIAEITDKPLQDEVIQAAWKNLHFTLDPIAASLTDSAKDAEAIGLLEPVDLTGIYDLTILDSVLAELGLDPVEGP